MRVKLVVDRLWNQVGVWLVPEVASTGKPQVIET